MKEAKVLHLYAQERETVKIPTYPLFTGASFIFHACRVTP